jgi:hypothetical protein
MNLGGADDFCGGTIGQNDHALLFSSGWRLPHAVVPGLFGTGAGSHAVDVIGAALHPWSINRGESCLTSHYSPKAEASEF